MCGMNKNILAASIAAALPFSIANQVGYHGHCEIKPAQCLQDEHAQLHIELDEPASVLNGISNTTISPGSGTVSLSGSAGAIATATGNLTVSSGAGTATGTASIVEQSDTVAAFGSTSA
jgi:hypothetical protein